MLKSKKIMQGVMVLAAVVILSNGMAEAQHNHNHSAAPAAKTEHQGMSHHMSMADRPVQVADIQGMKVSLDVMDMGMHVHMQGMKGNPVPDTYNAKQSQAIMVMINNAASEKAIKDATVAITVISPSGKKKTSNMPWCGDHYGESFTPAEKGTYRIVIKVEGQEGKGQTTFKYEFKG